MNQRQALLLRRVGRIPTIILARWRNGILLYWVSHQINNDHHMPRDRPKVQSLWTHQNKAAWWPVPYHEGQVEGLMSTYSYQELRTMASRLGLDPRISKKSLAISIVTETVIFFPDEVGHYAHQTLLHLVRWFKLLPQCTPPELEEMSKGALQKALLDAWKGGSVEDMQVSIRHVTELHAVMKDLEEHLCSSRVKKILRRRHRGTPSLHEQVEQRMLKVLDAYDRWNNATDQAEKRDGFIQTRLANIRAEEAVTEYLKVVQKYCRTRAYTCPAEDMPSDLQAWLRTSTIKDKVALCNVTVQGRQVEFEVGQPLTSSLLIFVVSQTFSAHGEPITWLGVGSPEPKPPVPLTPPVFPTASPLPPSALPPPVPADPFEDRLRKTVRRQINTGSGLLKGAFIAALLLLTSALANYQHIKIFPPVQTEPVAVAVRSDEAERPTCPAPPVMSRAPERSDDVLDLDQEEEKEEKTEKVKEKEEKTEEAKERTGTQLVPTKKPREKKKPVEDTGEVIDLDTLEQHEEEEVIPPIPTTDLSPEIQAFVRRLAEEARTSDIPEPLHLTRRMREFEQMSPAQQAQVQRQVKAAEGFLKPLVPVLHPPNTWRRLMQVVTVQILDHLSIPPRTTPPPNNRWQVGAFHYSPSAELRRIVGVLGERLPSQVRSDLLQYAEGGNQFLQVDPTWVSRTLSGLASLIQDDPQMSPTAKQNALADVRTVRMSPEGGGRRGVTIEGLPTVRVHDTFAHAVQVLSEAPLPPEGSLTSAIAALDDPSLRGFRVLGTILDDSRSSRMQTHLPDGITGTLLFPDVSQMVACLRSAHLRPWHRTFDFVVGWIDRHRASSRNEPERMGNLILTHGSIERIVLEPSRRARDVLDEFRALGSGRDVGWAEFLTGAPPQLLTGEAWVLQPDFSVHSRVVDLWNRIDHGLGGRRYTTQTWFDQWMQAPAVEYTHENIALRLLLIRDEFPDYVRYLPEVAVQTRDATPLLLRDLIEAATKHPVVGLGVIPHVGRLRELLSTGPLAPVWERAFPVLVSTTSTSVMTVIPVPLSSGAQVPVEYDSAFAAVGGGNNNAPLQPTPLRVQGVEEVKPAEPIDSVNGGGPLEMQPTERPPEKLVLPRHKLQLDVDTRVLTRGGADSRLHAHSAVPGWYLSVPTQGDVFVIDVLKSWLHDAAFHFKVSSRVPLESVMGDYAADLLSEPIVTLAPHFRLWQSLKGDVSLMTRLVYSFSSIPEAYALVYDGQISRFVLTQFGSLPGAKSEPTGTLSVRNPTVDPMAGTGFLADPDPSRAELFRLLTPASTNSTHTRPADDLSVVGVIDPHSGQAHVSAQPGARVKVSGASLWNGKGERQSQAAIRCGRLMRALVEHGSDEGMTAETWQEIIATLTTMVHTSTVDPNTDIVEILRQVQTDVTPPAPWLLSDSDLVSTVLSVLSRGVNPLSQRVFHSTFELIPASKLWLNVARRTGEPQLWDALNLVLRQHRAEEVVGRFRDHVMELFAPWSSAVDMVMSRFARTSADPLVYLLSVVQMLAPDGMAPASLLQLGLEDAVSPIEAHRASIPELIERTLGRAVDPSLARDYPGSLARARAYLERHGSPGIFRVAMAHDILHGTDPKDATHLASAAISTWRTVALLLSQPRVGSQEEARREPLIDPTRLNEAGDRLLNFVSRDRTGGFLMKPKHLNHFLQDALRLCLTSEDRWSNEVHREISYWRETCDWIEQTLRRDPQTRDFVQDFSRQLGQLAQANGQRTLGEYWRGFLPTPDARGRLEQLVRESLVPPPIEVVGTTYELPRPGEEVSEWHTREGTESVKQAFDRIFCPFSVTDLPPHLRDLSTETWMNRVSNVVTLPLRWFGGWKGFMVQEIMSPWIRPPLEQLYQQTKDLLGATPLGRWVGEGVKELSQKYPSLIRLQRVADRVIVELMIRQVSISFTSQFFPDRELMRTAPAVALSRVADSRSDVGALASLVSPMTRQMLERMGSRNTVDVAQEVFRMQTNAMNRYLFEASQDPMAAATSLLQSLTQDGLVNPRDAAEGYRSIQSMLGIFGPAPASWSDHTVGRILHPDRGAILEALLAQGARSRQLTEALNGAPEAWRWLENIPSR